MLAGTAKVWCLLTLFIMTLFINPVYAVDCPWTATTGLQNNMVVYGELYVNQQKITNDGYCIGAFGPGGLGDCRAVGTSGISVSLYYLTLGGNINGDIITFKVFEKATGLVVDVTETVAFSSDETQTINIHASSCTYTLSTGSDSFASTSAIGTITVTPSSSSCSWTATSNDSWITITSGNSGTGTGTVTYSVAANSGAARTGTIIIGGVTFPVNQAASTSAPPPSSGGGGGGGCFIATAAWGSYLDPHVQVLGSFRDHYLITNSPGKAFVEYYYSISPPIAGYIKQHESLRTTTRFILTPIVYGIEYPWLVLIFGGVVIGVWGRKKKKNLRSSC